MNDIFSVGAVVVTFNRKELLKESIEALLKVSYEKLKIFVIDNNSTDGTGEFISDLIDGEKVIYKNTGANLGGAGGFNFGMKMAVQAGCDYIWIMDDDCIVHPDSLEKLLNFAKSVNYDFGFLSSKVLWKDGSPCRMNVQRNSLSKEINLNGGNQKVCLASFVSMLMRREVIEDVGLPIKDFFIWGDDWEYTYRISKSYNCYYVAESEVTHKCNSNMGVNIVKDESDRLNRYYYAYRNEGYFYKKAGLKGKIYFFLKKNLHLFKLLFTKTKNRKEKLKILKSGVKDSKKFNPKIEYVFSGKDEVKVLEFFGEPLQYGGQEAFMVNMYKNFNRENINYTFCTPFDLTNKTLIELAEKRNEKIIHYDYKFFSKFRKLYIKKAIKRVLKENKFDVIHIQSGSIYTLLNVAKIAKKKGVKKVIVHSHATGNNNFKYRLIKHFSDKKIDKYADNYFACSMLAGKWKFPKNVVSSEHFRVINNGIDTKKFTFNMETRQKYREELKLGDFFTMINVGRFAEMKNHKFMVDIASKLRDNGLNFKFIFIGEGELKEETITKINNLNLNDFFIFLEKRSDVAEIMMASDLFMLPSTFEGLGIVAIESQASGLITICSNNVPHETKLTDLISYLPLDNIDNWVNKIIESKDIAVSREKYSKLIEDNGYDSKTSAEILENKYLGE